MRPRWLTLASFEDFAMTEFPEAFAEFPQTDEYTFEHKKIDTNYSSKRHEMLLVGRYHTQNATLPNVWACTFGSDIGYYVSLGGTLLAKLAPDPARIYFKDEPFSLMIGGKSDEVLYTVNHARRGYLPSINNWRDVIESVITFVFLKTGRLDRVFITDWKAMLENFRVACMHFSENTQFRFDDYDYPVKREQPDTESPIDAPFRETVRATTKRKKPNRSTKVKVEEDDSDDDWDFEEYKSHPRKSARIHALQSRPIPRQSSTFTLPSIRTSRSNIIASSTYKAYSSTDTNPRHELKSLKLALTQEKRKLQNTERELARERVKHISAERRKATKDREIQDLEQKRATLRGNVAAISRKYSQESRI